MTTLDKKAAFLHVIDSHRWLAASGCAWNLVGANAVGKVKDEAHQCLPNIDVMIRDCLLLHARSLIKFYKSKGGCEDIVLADFGIGPIKDPALENYERPIEVHLLHLTDWRDIAYRNSHTPKRGKTYRPNCDKEVSIIAEKLIECLRYTSEQSGRWQEPLRELYNATAARYRDESYLWPKHLSEKADVEHWLKSLGL